MKKTVRLTESELIDVIKKIIREQGEPQAKAGDDVTVDKLPKEIQDFVKTYGLTGTFNYTSVNGQLGITFGYNKGNFHTGISVDDIKSYEQNKGNVGKCDERGQKWKEIYNNLRSSIRNPQELMKQAKSELNKLYPNMEYCGAVKKLQDIIKMR